MKPLSLPWTRTGEPIFDLRTGLSVPENPVRKLDFFHLASTCVLLIYALLHSEHHGNFKSSKFKTKWPPHAKQGNFQDFYLHLTPSRHSSKSFLFTTRLFLAFGDTRFNQWNHSLCLGREKVSQSSTCELDFQFPKNPVRESDFFI